jgi:hypothetical protein
VACGAALGLLVAALVVPQRSGEDQD